MPMLTASPQNIELSTIVILTGQEFVEPLVPMLMRQNPGFEFRFVETIEALREIHPILLKCARLISFGSSHIVPKDILQSLGFGAYNFHPGSPEYPGWSPFDFAIYDGATHYGTTLHVMTEKVDAGAIVGVDTFPIPLGTTTPQLMELSKASLFRLFGKMMRPLMRHTPLAALPVAWEARKTTKKSLAAQCQIDKDISKEELLRRVYAFGYGDNNSLPTVELHGIRFVLAPGQVLRAADALAASPTLARSVFSPRPRSRSTRTLAVASHHLVPEIQQAAGF